MSPQTRSEIKALLDHYRVSPKRRLGQHFLADPNVTRRIAAEAGVGPGDRVVEVGAGTGTLTLALIETGATVVSYETDQRLRPLLEEVVAGRAEFRFEDVTKVDLSEAFSTPPWVMVANLPYNVGTPLVMDVLREVPAIVRLVVMVQREVADRFVARPGDPDYGVPSIVAAIYSLSRLVMRVPRQVFYPMPNVESAVVVIDRVPTPPWADRAVDLARAGFAQRRKMLRSSLAGVMDAEQLTRAGVDPTARAENLDAADYLRLAEL